MKETVMNRLQTNRPSVSYNSSELNDGSLYVSNLQQTHKMVNKFLIFVLTSWSYASLEGTASAFSMTKEPMSEKLQLTQTFLGTIDSITIFGTIVGTFLMVSLTKGIKFSFLIFSIIHSVFFCMLMLSQYIDESVGKTLIMVCMFIVGLAKASVVFPQILFSNFFDSTEQKFYFNLWYGITFLGDTFGILISKLIISKLRLNWEYNLIFFSAVLLLSTILIYFLISDPPQDNAEEEHQQTIWEIMGDIRNFLRPTANKLIAADFALEEVLYNDIILWMPLSYEINELAGQDYIATLAFPVMIAFGAVITEYPLSFCEDKSRYILTFMTLINFGNFLAMFILQLSKQTVWVHVILLSFSGLIMGAPYSRVCSGDPAEVCQGNPHKIHIAFFTINFVRYISSAAAFFLIGYFLQTGTNIVTADKKALQMINLITAILILVIGFLRRFIFPPQLDGSTNQLPLPQDILDMEKKPSIKL